MRKTFTFILLQIILLLQVIRPSQQQPTPCYNPISISSPGWVAATSTPYYEAYACGLRADHVAIAEPITFTIDDSGCPDSCSRLPYACGEIAAAAETNQGLYECVMKPSAVSGTVTTCSVTSSTRTPYEEIFIKFFGNDTSSPVVGFFTKGVAYHAGPVRLTFAADADYHSYSFEWTSGYIKWYADGVEIASETSRPVPTYPNRFVVNFVTEVAGINTDDSAILTAPSVGRNFVMPSSAPQSSFTGLTFTPVIYQSCDNTSGIIPGPTNWTEPNPNACSSRAVKPIYRDSLESGWSDSGSSTHRIQSTTFVHTGSAAIAWDVKPSAVLVIRGNENIDTNNYYGIEFWVHGGGQSGQQIVLSLLTDNGVQATQINLAELLVSGIQPNSWSRVVAPFSRFALPPDTHAVGLQFSATANTFQGTVSFDDILLSQQYPICANSHLVIYNDQLARGWSDQSWGEYTLASTERVWTGTYAIEWELYNSNAIQFTTGDTLNTDDWKGISLYINYQKLTGWQINIAVITPNGPVGRMGLLNYYSGSFPPGDWVNVVIPFTQFGLNPGASINGFQITCATQDYQGFMYIDDVSFINSKSFSPKLNAGLLFSLVLTFVLYSVL